MARDIISAGQPRSLYVMTVNEVIIKQINKKQMRWTKRNTFIIHIPNSGVTDR
jgi:hypothetical protein